MFSDRAMWALFKNMHILYFGCVLHKINKSENAFSYKARVWQIIKYGNFFKFKDFLRINLNQFLKFLLTWFSRGRILKISLKMIKMHGTRIASIFKVFLIKLSTLKSWSNITSAYYILSRKHFVRSHCTSERRCQ